MESAKTMLADLDPERFLFVEDILMAILELDLTEGAFAQMLDGLPTRTAFSQTRGERPEAPAIIDREEPTEESRIIYRELRQWLQPASLALDSQALQSYQDTTLFSDQFFFRLLEVVALAVHSLGQLAYTSSHPDNRPPYHPSGFPHRPPDLFHPNYAAKPLCPHGLSDAVGYWVKTQIFGGVVLFQREGSHSASKVLCP